LQGTAARQRERRKRCVDVWDANLIPSNCVHLTAGLPSLDCLLNCGDCLLTHETGLRGGPARPGSVKTSRPQAKCGDAPVMLHIEPRQIRYEAGHSIRNAGNNREG
jgi:hypothetical protein